MLTLVVAYPIHVPNICQRTIHGEEVRKFLIETSCRFIPVSFRKDVLRAMLTRHLHVTVQKALRKCPAPRVQVEASDPLFALVLVAPSPSPLLVMAAFLFSNTRNSGRKSRDHTCFAGVQMMTPTSTRNR